MIPLSEPSFGDHERQLLSECLESTWISTSGEYIQEFEAGICRYTGAKHAIACVNCTAALFISLKVVGVQQGDEVLVPTLSYIATANTVRYLGAYPVFMDCDEYYCIDSQKTMEFLTDSTRMSKGECYNKLTNRRVKAIVAVHAFGNAARILELKQLCESMNVVLIEDAAGSFGTRYSLSNGASIHTGRIGAVGCFSFNGNKIVTAGGGGAIITDDPYLATKAQHLIAQAIADPISYIHDEIGYNLRMTNLHAAIGVAQLNHIDEFIDIKKRNYAHYRTGLQSILGLQIADVPSWSICNHWYYCLQIDETAYGANPLQLMKRLRTLDIETRPIWYPCHLQPYLSRFQHHNICRALRLHAATLNVPCSVTLSSDSITRITAALRNCHEETHIDVRQDETRN